MSENCHHAWALKNVGDASIIYCEECRRTLTGKELVGLAKAGQAILEYSERDWTFARCACGGPILTRRYGRNVRASYHLKCNLEALLS